MLSTSVVVVFWAFISLALALPMITNTNLDDIEQGKPFKLEFNGCDDGCNITLAAFNGTGDNKSIQNYGNWEVPAGSTDYTLTLDHLQAGDYWFYLKIGSHNNRYPAVSQSPTFHLSAASGGSGTQSSSPPSPSATNEPTSTHLPTVQSTRSAAASSAPTVTTIPNSSGTLIRWTVFASAVNFGALVILL